jgi:SAM-dependent methyltransferase
MLLGIDAVGALAALRLERFDLVPSPFQGSSHEATNGMRLPAHLLHDLRNSRAILPLQHRHDLGLLAPLARARFRLGGFWPWIAFWAPSWQGWTSSPTCSSTAHAWRPWARCWPLLRWQSPPAWRLQAARSGRGTVTRRLALFARASEWLQERAAGSLTVLGPLPATTPRKAIPKGVDAYLVEGSSERISLPSGSADLVLTDPPYHDDVQYDELSLPLRAWSRLSTQKLINKAVVNSTNGFSTESHDYRDLLSRIFRECQRILKPTGRLILSYANRQPEAWIDLFAALQLAGFWGVNYAIVHSQNETDHAKRGIRACALDLMMELSPRAATPLLRPKVTVSGPEADYLRTVGEKCLEIGRLQSGWHVSFAQALKETPFLCGPTQISRAKPEGT